MFFFQLKDLENIRLEEPATFFVVVVFVFFFYESRVKKKRTEHGDKNNHPS